MKKILLLVLGLILLFSCMVVASVEVDSVEYRGMILNQGDTIIVESGSNFGSNVEIYYTGIEDGMVEIGVFLEGFDFPVGDVEVSNIEEGVTGSTDVETFQVPRYYNIDFDRDYKMVVYLDGEMVLEYNLIIELSSEDQRFFDYEYGVEQVVDDLDERLIIIEEELEDTQRELDGTKRELFLTQRRLSNVEDELEDTSDKLEENVEETGKIKQVLDKYTSILKKVIEFLNRFFSFENGDYNSIDPFRR